MKPRKPKTNSRVLCEELEPRILFSADGLAGGETVVAAVDQREQVLVLSQDELSGLSASGLTRAQSAASTESLFAEPENTGFKKLESLFSESKSASLVNQPVFVSAGPYFVDEGASETTVVGDVQANDGDGGATDAGITYSIISNVNPDGDGNEAFAIDSSTGVITVNDADDLDFENAVQHNIAVQINDGEFTNSRNVQVNVNDVQSILTATGTGQVNAGVAYTLNLNATEPGISGINSYTVNWGDGTITNETYAGTTTSLTHTYANPGVTYNITFTANESSGSFTTSSMIVTRYSAGNDDVFLFDAETGAAEGQFLSSGGDLDRPYGLSIGPDGNIYVAGYDSDNIVFYNADGSYGGVFASGSGLDLPTSVAWGSDGKMYVSNSGGGDILRFEADGTFDIIYASGGGLVDPEDLAFSPNGDLYVSSYTNKRVLKIDADTQAITTELQQSDGLSNPTQLQFGENGDLFIANPDNDEVLRWDGSAVTQYFTHPQLADATGIAFGPDGDLYVSNYTAGTVLRYDGSTGSVIADDGPGGLTDASYIAFTPAHQVLIVQNAPPSANNLVSSSSYTEGASSVAITDIDVADPDSPEVITATLTLANTAAGSLSANDGASYSSGSGIWTITDNVANVNTALANLVFIPQANNDQNTSISVSIDDGDEDLSGALTGNIALNVTPINDAPTATNLSAAEGYVEDTPLNLIDIVVSDDDNGNTTVTLSLSDVAAGTLSTATAGSVTSTYNAGTGVWSASGDIADVNTLLADLTFTPSLDYNSNFDIATSVSDGSAPPVVGTKNMLGTATNDAPTATNTSAAESYTEDVPLNLVDIVIADVDDASTTVSLALSDLAAGTLSTATSGSVTSTYNPGSGVWTATGAIADVNAVLADVTFTPSLNYASDFTISTTVTDGQASALVDTKFVSATAVNDPPTATNLNSAESYVEDTPLYLTDIVVSDVDNTTTTVTLTLSEASAGSLSTGTSGTVTSSFNSGTGVWSASGDMADVNSLLADVVFTPALNYNSNFSIASTVGDGIVPPILGTKVVTATADNDDWHLWLTTDDVSSSGGAPGLESWGDSTFLEFREPNFALGENSTNGTFNAVFDLDSFSSSNSEIEAIHHVGTDLTLGGRNFPSIDVRVGDVIFSTKSSETLTSVNSINNSNKDVVLFSPTVPGNYSSGTFTVLLEDVNGKDIQGISLVERETTLPDGTVLGEGDFLFASKDHARKILWFVTEDVGVANTNGQERELLNGNDPGINISSDIQGIDLIENGTSLAGVDLAAGQILVSTENTISGGSNNQPFTRNDIVVLTIAQTTWQAGGGNGSASVNILLDGSDVALDSGSERIHGISLISTNTGGGNSAPRATNLSSAETYTEDLPLNLTDIVVSDVDHSVTSVTLSLSDAAAGSLSTGTSGAVTSSFNAGSGIWTASGDIADVNTLLAGLVFTPALNYSDNFTIETSVSDGVASAVSGSKNIVGTAINDAPTATNLNLLESYIEDTALVLADIVVSDVDDTITSVSLALSDPAAGFLSTGTSGAVTSSYNSITGVWSANGPIADVNSLLSNITFTPSSNYNGNFTIAASVSDGKAALITGTKVVLGTPVNDAPKATNLNTNDTFTEDAVLNLQNIVVSDLDHPTTSVSLTLSDSAAGALTTGTSGAITSVFDPVSGIWSAAGLITDVNALLANVSFVPSANYNSTFNIRVDVSDGVAASVSGTKVLTGIAVNDAPTATNLNTTESYTEDTALNLTDIVIADVDHATTTIGLLLLDAQVGSLSTATSGSVTSTFDAENGIWRASGAISDVNNLLSGLIFTPSLNHNGDFEVAVSILDGASSPVMGTKRFIGNAVNDNPVANVGGVYQIKEGDSFVPDASTSADIDGSIVRYEWLIGSTVILSSSSPNPTIDWPLLNTAGVVDDSASAYDLTLRVIDDSGGIDTDTLELRVGNTPPAVSVSGASTAVEGARYTLNLDANDPGNDTITSWTIDWGDGTIETLLGKPSSVEHIYSTPGITYLISVMVSDEDGNHMAEDVSVDVLANQAASLALVSNSLTLVDSIDTSARTFLTDIQIVDDGVGSNALSLSGADAGLFEIENGALYLRAGVELNFDSDGQLEVEIQIDDPSLGTGPEDSQVFVLNIEEDFGVIDLNGLEGYSRSFENQSTPQAASDSSEQEQAVDDDTEGSSTPQENVADTNSILDRGIMPGATRSIEVTAEIIEAATDVIDVDDLIKKVLPENLVLGASTQADSVLTERQLDLLELIQEQPLNALTLSTALEAIDLMEGYSFVDNDSFISGLDEVRQQLGDINLDKQLVIGSSTVVSSSLSIGYIIWLLRGSVLLSALLSSLPAWRMIDPLPILHGTLSDDDADEDEDTLQSIIESSEDESVTQHGEDVDNEQV